MVVALDMAMPGRKNFFVSSRLVLALSLASDINRDVLVIWFASENSINTYK